MATGFTVGGAVLLPAAVLDPPGAAGWLLLVSIAFQCAYQILLIASYDRGGLSVTYPVARGVTPILVVVGGAVLLDQIPDATTVLGMFVLTIGLLGLGSIAHQWAQLRAVGFAVATGVAITGYSLTDASAVREVGPLGYFAVVAFSAGSIVLIITGVGWRRIRESLPVGARVGVMQMSAYVLILLAFERAQAGQVASLRQVSVVIGVLLAGEAARGRAFVGSSMVALGAILVAW